MNQYQKINTLYKRFMKLGDCPNPKWRMWQNKIIMGCFTDPTVKYLKDCLWEGYSKIDGTNSKICYFPSNAELLVGGKTDKASSQHGQFEMLQEIGDKIKPELEKLFPKDGAKFAPVKEGNKIQFVDKDGVPEELTENGLYCVYVNEVPVYIYGEYYGQGIQNCGGRYHDYNDFRVFDIDAQGWWVPSDIRNAWCKQLGLKTVPFIGIRTLSEFEKMVMDGFTTLVDGVKDPTLIEEGIVARPVIPIKDARGNRIIVKIKYCDYKEWAETRKQFTDEEYNEFLEWYKNNIEPID